MELGPDSNPPASQEVDTPRQFSMDTFVIPPGVDLQLAGQRNRIIIEWREGKREAYQALYSLLMLYWQHAPYSDETGVYLMQPAYQFPVEAGLSMDDADAAYEHALDDKNRMTVIPTLPLE